MKAKRKPSEIILMFASQEKTKKFMNEKRDRKATAKALFLLRAVAGLG
jgi:hypothetical protein